MLAIPANLSFSQTGEDSILAYYLNNDHGFYVDVGANEPMRFSSSFRFYLKGWRGIAVDANSGLINRFKKARRRDICIAAAVSNCETEVIFHKSEDSAVSTIDAETFEKWKENWEFNPENQISLRTRTLTSILEENMPPEEDTIDILTVDVEGHEFEVLSGLDLSIYRPKMIVVEMHDMKAITSDETYLLLTQNGYALIGYITINAYFVDTASKN